MNRPNVFGLFAAPTRNDSLRAISLAVLRAKANHSLTYAQMGELLDVSEDTVSNAANEHSLLGSDTLLRFGFFFPEEYKLVDALLTMKAAEPLTLQDRAERLAKEIAAIQRELDGQNPMRGAA